MIKEIAASYWRIRRAWAIESQMLSMRKQAGPTEIDRMTEAFGELAARPKLSLLHRYESRLHIMFQRGLHNLLVLRQAENTKRTHQVVGNSGKSQKRTLAFRSTSPLVLLSAPPEALSDPDPNLAEDQAPDPCTPTLPELIS